jgi:biopolymer transport protein ExbD
MRRTNIQDDNAQIDLTPMLDVVFILLIFFILSTSFTKESSIQIDRPKASSATLESKQNILITIDKDGFVWMDGVEIELNTLKSNIKRLKAINPKYSVIIQADILSQTGVLVEVMDAVRIAGIKDIAVSTILK